MTCEVSGLYIVGFCFPGCRAQGDRERTEDRQTGESSGEESIKKATVEKFESECKIYINMIINDMISFI